MAVLAAARKLGQEAINSYCIVALGTGIYALWKDIEILCEQRREARIAEKLRMAGVPSAVRKFGSQVTAVGFAAVAFYGTVVLGVELYVFSKKRSFVRKMRETGS